MTKAADETHSEKLMYLERRSRHFWKLWLQGETGQIVTSDAAQDA